MTLSDPKSSAVVDDHAKFVSVPARLGVVSILADPKATSDTQFITVKSVGELFSPGVLPSLKRNSDNSVSVEIA